MSDHDENTYVSQSSILRSSDLCILRRRSLDEAYATKATATENIPC